MVLKNVDILVKIRLQMTIEPNKNGIVLGLNLKYLAAKIQATGIEIKAINMAKPKIPNLFLVLIINLFRLVNGDFAFRGKYAPTLLKTQLPE